MGKIIVNDNKFYGKRGGGKFLKGKESALYLDILNRKKLIPKYLDIK
ncbi:hypothetical protein ES708_04005 [subsurface metagenome]